jgi:hypothetical protein
VSSLSDAQVIELISKYFVPAWASRDHYQQTDFQAEQEELLRIDRSKEKKGLPGGVVCVYLLDADGEVYSSLPVQQAWKPDKLIPLLKDYIDKEKLKPRDPDAVKAGTAPPPPAPKPKADDAVLVHVWTRIDEKTGVNRGIGSDLVELTADEWKALLPAKDAKAGDSWKVAPDAVEALYRYFYPPLPHWKVSESKLVGASLTATVVSASDKEVSVRLEGDIDLIYPFTGKPTDARATGKLYGFARVDPAKKTLTAFALASEDAEFVGSWDGKPQPRKMRMAAELEPKDK